MEIPDIRTYYENLAETYDENRFANSYGQFIDAQEQEMIHAFLPSEQAIQTLDIGCGTGRLSRFAHTGLDDSPRMLEVAKKKHPGYSFVQGSITTLPFPECSFQNAICFHVFMHHNEAVFLQALQEAHRVLKPGGLFIFDLPSTRRRKWKRDTGKSWHAAYHCTVQDIQTLCGTQWELVKHRGVCFLPIHRVPPRFRLSFLTIDNLMCKSVLRSYSSYLVYVLRKK